MAKKSGREAATSTTAEKLIGVPRGTGLAEFNGGAGVDTIGPPPDVELAAVGRCERSTFEHAVRAGELLLRAKSKLKHGEWGPWLGRYGVAERTAQRCMRLAKSHAEGGLGLSANPPRAADFELSIRAVEAMLKTERSAEAGDSDDLPPPSEPTPRDAEAGAVPDVTDPRIDPDVSPPSTLENGEAETQDSNTLRERADDARRPLEIAAALSTESGPVAGLAPGEDAPEEPGGEPVGFSGIIRELEEAFEAVIDLCRGLGEVDLGGVDPASRVALAGLAKRAGDVANQASRTLSAPPRRAR